LTGDSLIILSPGFAAGEDDTICMPYVQMFIKALRNSFPALQIHIISLQYPYTASVYDWHGVKVYALGGRNKKWNRFFTWQKAGKLIDQLCAETNVVGIFSLWLTECTYIAQKLSKKHGLQTIAWCMGQDAKKTNRYIRHLDTSLFRIGCMSPFLAEQLQLNHGIKDTCIIGNGIYPETIPPAVSKEKIYDIISVGAFSDFKQFDWVVDVVQVLKKEFPGIKACMVGSGPEWQSIQNRISALDLSANIELKGSLPHTDCLELMMHSKLLLHPSSYEGASTVVLEALYYRCYVISITVPAAAMPPVFYKAATKDEMIRKAKELLLMECNEQSYCVTTSLESAQKLMRMFGYKQIAP
jgi:glycosyltransferase involved in cell wall biosynthesis